MRKVSLSVLEASVLEAGVLKASVLEASVLEASIREASIHEASVCEASVFGQDESLRGECPRDKLIAEKIYVHKRLGVVWRLQGVSQRNWLFVPRLIQ